MHERLRNEELGRIKKCKKFVLGSWSMSQDGDDENDKNLNMTDQNIFQTRNSYQQDLTATISIDK